MQGQKIQKDRIKAIGGIALVVAVLIAVAAAFFFINLEERKRAQPPEFLTFTGNRISAAAPQGGPLFEREGGRELELGGNFVTGNLKR